eukprot:1162127-Pelagomonas_calceolata.AAC.9
MNMRLELTIPNAALSHPHTPFLASIQRYGGGAQTPHALQEQHQMKPHQQQQQQQYESSKFHEHGSVDTAWPCAAGYALLEWLEQAYPRSSSTAPTAHTSYTQFPEIYISNPFAGLSYAVAADEEAWRAALCCHDLGRPAAAAAAAATAAAAARAAELAAAEAARATAQDAEEQGPGPKRELKKESSLTFLASAANMALAAMMGQGGRVGDQMRDALLRWCVGMVCAASVSWGAARGTRSGAGSVKAHIALSLPLLASLLLQSQAPVQTVLRPHWSNWTSPHVDIAAGSGEPSPRPSQLGNQSFSGTAQAYPPASSGPQPTSTSTQRQPPVSRKASQQEQRAGSAAGSALTDVCVAPWLRTPQHWAEHRLTSPMHWFLLAVLLAPAHQAGLAADWLSRVCLGSCSRQAATAIKRIGRVREAVSGEEEGSRGSAEPGARRGMFRADRQSGSGMKDAAVSSVVMRGQQQQQQQQGQQQNAHPQQTTVGKLILDPISREIGNRGWARNSSSRHNARRAGQAQPNSEGGF